MRPQIAATCDRLESINILSSIKFLVGKIHSSFAARNATFLVRNLLTNKRWEHPGHAKRTCQKRRGSFHNQRYGETVLWIATWVARQKKILTTSQFNFIPEKFWHFLVSFLAKNVGAILSGLISIAWAPRCLGTSNEFAAPFFRYSRKKKIDERWTSQTF